MYQDTSCVSRKNIQRTSHVSYTVLNVPKHISWKDIQHICDVSYTIENVPRHMMCQLEGYSAYMSFFLYCINCANTHDVSTRRKLCRNLSHVMRFRKYITKFHLSYRRHVKDIQKWNVLYTHNLYIYFVKYTKFIFCQV